MPHRNQERSIYSSCLAIVVFGLRATSPVLVRVILPFACLALAVFLLLRAIMGADKLTRDARRPRVESLDGPISKHRATADSHGSPGSSVTTYSLERFPKQSGNGDIARSTMC